MLFYIEKCCSIFSAEATALLLRLFLLICNIASSGSFCYFSPIGVVMHGYRENTVVDG